jgi:methionine-rich copper-binding protein CopC
MKGLIIFAAGVAIGVICTSIYSRFDRSDSIVWTTTAPLTSEDGLIIPTGTELIYDDSMSEGFSRAKLYLNISPEIENTRIKSATSEHKNYIPPIWVK